MKIRLVVILLCCVNQVFAKADSESLEEKCKNLPCIQICEENFPQENLLVRLSSDENIEKVNIKEKFSILNQFNCSSRSLLDESWKILEVMSYREVINILRLDILSRFDLL